MKDFIYFNTSKLQVKSRKYFDIIFVYSFCQSPEITDKGHRQVLAAKFFTQEIDRTCVAVHQEP